MHASLSDPPADSPDLRLQALHALRAVEPEEKVALTHAIFARLNEGEAALDPAIRLMTPADVPLPGRPNRPVLVPPLEVPHRSPYTPEGLAALLHAVTHIEFNAIALALDAVWRFDGMPAAYYADWLRVADEEATHFTLLNTLLQDMGHRYGDFPAHDGLWEMCVKTEHDVTARMALVPRTLEARGLDATPPMQARLRKVGTPHALRAVGILDVILRDEVGHVAVGNRWYAWLCQQQGLDPLAHYRHLSRLHRAPRPKPPFNDAARRAAGFNDAEMQALLQSTDTAPELVPISAMSGGS